MQARDRPHYQRAPLRPKSGAWPGPGSGGEGTLTRSARATRPTIPGMQTLYDVLVWLHVLSWVVALVGYVTTVRRPQLNAAMVVGVTAAFVLGVALAGVAPAADVDLNYAKIGLKLVVAFVAVGLAHGTRRRPTPNPFAHAVAGLIVVNVAIAYLWT